MPYIVTTKRPCPACQYGPNAGGEHRPDSVSRVAVGTLEEAHCLAYDLAKPGPRGERHNHQAALLLPKAGGTVGPLPDGTLIEVEPATYYALWHAVPWDSGLRGGAYMETEGEQNIAAFNEANRVPSS